MKNIILPIVFFLTSCASIKKMDTTGFSTTNNSIIYEKDTVAVLSAIEYSIDGDKFVKEMTFKLVNMNHADKVKNLLYFIHARHKDWEIEIDYPVTNFKFSQK
jgi:hypothetical protein